VCSFNVEVDYSVTRMALYVYFCTVLHFAREDEKAFHCKIVCLIQLSQFEEALKVLKNNPKLGR